MSTERILEILHCVVESSRKKKNLKKNKENAFWRRSGFCNGKEAPGSSGSYMWKADTNEAKSVRGDRSCRNAQYLPWFISIFTKTT